MIRLLVSTCLVALSAPALASAPDAWDSHYREVVRNCLSASKLRQAKPASDLLMFSDSIGTALIVRGKPAGKSKETQLLCIQRRGQAGPPELMDINDGVKAGAYLPK